MRTSTIVTVSLPPAMLVVTKKIARKQHMTQSELFRTALRVYVEEQEAQEAIRIFEHERRAGTLKELKGSLTDLMR